MSIIKCKMCGGELNLTEGQSVAECEYCGSRQTVPNPDNEKKLLQFERAERLRKNCEFDKAASLFEAIVAEHRQEAEAYWGLVLCRYGIEYVDDPATGKKIPTCHRVSFDSILEDPDFEQAMENADVVARRVYRQEAKIIDEIRQGILAVSASEKPYDIFICYKETDEKGDRTLDSVLAQDIYDALTRKGYRVFFARITLEDKLGQAYEPYIFAALNSAKVMLAVGTDYEYFNAVWVKNEWSRFLKLMAGNPEKYLIPCYKGIDAYDMPKEFARLQAQDLGKMGAIQDLLRNMEKYIPLAKPQVQTVVQEQVVVGGTAGNKIASALHRGNMALEDGDWAKADSFFEDVLSNDSMNAQGYLGKTLAQEKCRSMDAFIRKRLDAHRSVRGETWSLKSDQVRVQKMVASCAIPGYLEEKAIRELYDFDLRYHSDVTDRKAQCNSEENYWATHKQLSKAEKFANGEMAQTIAREKKRLFDALSQQLKQAEAAEKAAVDALTQKYEAHLAQADEKVRKLHEEACARREEKYDNLLISVKNCENPGVLDTCAAGFEALGDFRDSKKLAQHCRTRAKEIREEQERRKREEEEQRLIAQRKAEREAAAKKKKITILSVAVAAVALAVLLLVTQVIIPSSNYDKAEALAAEGKYLEAAAAFKAMGDYKDSFEKSFEIWGKVTQRDTISAGGSHTVGLKVDGTVVAVGRNDNGRCDVSGWTDIVAISAGAFHTVGLKADGTVVAVGSNSHGQCDVSGWQDIVAISAGYEHTVGLKADGTVVAVGSNSYGQCDVSGWQDIVAISAGFSYTVGLKTDGTVVAVGWNHNGQCKVSGWTDIVAISAGDSHTVGLKADGTVVAVGYNKYGQCDVTEWTDIVAISAGFSYTVGLKADGTVVAVGDNDDGQCDVSGWTDIVAIAAGSYHTVGLKADGTVVAVGYNKYGQCDVSGWENIKLP